MAMKKGKTAFALALGARMKEARGERSFQDVSDASRGAVSARMIDNYEQGTEPRYSTLLILAAALGCRLSDLVPAPVIRASERKQPGMLLELLN